MKTITKEWLRKKGACPHGVKWFLAQNETNTAKVMLKLVDEGRNNDALWVLEQIMNKKQSVQLAIFSSRLCLENFEKKYPNDDRPRMAIEAAEAYLKRPCEKTKSVARSAVESAAGYAVEAAAWAAAWSARSAAWSAVESAARSAARSAAGSARSAAWSARSATWSAIESASWSAAEPAAWDAARSAAINQIIREAIRICEL